MVHWGRNSGGDSCRRGDRGKTARCNLGKHQRYGAELEAAGVGGVRGAGATCTTTGGTVKDEGTGVGGVGGAGATWTSTGADGDELEGTCGGGVGGAWGKCRSTVSSGTEGTKGVVEEADAREECSSPDILGFFLEGSSVAGHGDGVACPRAARTFLVKTCRQASRSCCSSSSSGMSSKPAVARRSIAAHWIVRVSLGPGISSSTGCTETTRCCRKIGGPSSVASSSMTISTPISSQSETSCAGEAPTAAAAASVASAAGPAWSGREYGALGHRSLGVGMYTKGKGKGCCSLEEWESWQGLHAESPSHSCKISRKY